MPCEISIQRTWNILLFWMLFLLPFWKESYKGNSMMVDLVIRLSLVCRGLLYLLKWTKVIHIVQSGTKNVGCKKVLFSWDECIFVPFLLNGSPFVNRQCKNLGILVLVLCLRECKTTTIRLLWFLARQPLCKAKILLKDSKKTKGENEGASSVAMS